jgi:hypothetical protein
MLEEMAVDVRVRADATLVFIADGASFGDLQQQWPAVRFPDDVPIHLVLLDVDPDSVWLPGVRQPDSIRHHSTNQTSVATILQAIARKCSTER